MTDELAERLAKAAWIGFAVEETPPAKTSMDDPAFEHVRPSYLALAACMLAEIAAAGMVVVPREPTAEMLEAAWAYIHDENGVGTWKAMIEAAPTNPSP